MQSALAIIALAAVALLYLFPTFIAYHRKHRSRIAISAANVIFGWSGIGWLICFIYALSGDVEPQPEKSKKAKEGDSLDLAAQSALAAIQEAFTAGKISAVEFADAVAKLRQDK